MSRKLLATTALSLALLAGSSGAVLAQAAAPALPGVTPIAATTPTTSKKGNGAVIVLDADGQARIVASAGLGGIELYDLAGNRTNALPAGEVLSVDVRYGVPVGGKPTTVLGVTDWQGSKLRFFALEGGAGRDITGAEMKAGLSTESGCLYRSALDGTLYAFALGRAGEIEQWEIFDNGQGRLDGRLVRRLHLPSEASYCAASDADGAIYIAEQAVGVWKFGAEPEADTTPQLIDAARLGRITEEAGGIAVYDGGPGARYLIVSNASANSFHVYNRDKDEAFLGSFTLGQTEEASGLFATSAAGGLFLALDEDNADGATYRLARFGDIAGALKLNAGAPVDPRAPVPPTLPIVRPIAETEPVGQGGDAADDPAIWVNPADPARSLIVATDKQAGLGVYDLSGKRLFFAADGKMNNVDLRTGFKLGGQEVTLVTASDRTRNAIGIYVLNADGSLRNVAEGLNPTAGLGDPYGLCMYRGRKGKTYVFVNDTDGKMKQWRLDATPTGTVKAVPVREFAFDTQTEGCVADDDSGALYVAEEDVALWKMGAEPTAGAVRSQIASVAGNSALKDDLEGVSLYRQANGKGYLVVSSQGNNSYAVFERDGANAYVGSFAIVADGAKGIDGASETDGLDVTSGAMGPLFPNGALVVQDGRNVSPPEPQNFKIVPWTGIEAALKLPKRP